MGEPKPLASLSSSLLARKGQAKPAMRPQGFASFGFGGGNSHQHHEDLGWNDMGHEPESVAAPVSAEVVPILPVAAVEVPDELPAVVRQQEELKRELEPLSDSFAERAKRAAPGSKGKAAFTLRLDPDRHLQLRLACAVAHKSAQLLVVQALDAFLATQPGVGELAKAAGSGSAGK
ncbi:hypothetical protein [Sphingomonas sp. SUN039]|uniref:hypothetical protein n=1 Tax=Sphingomonas sp. SUN039 TaxID=2937787 RepID=UPI002164C05E|nr:hypothetical protein [Sphingomonas sp. SUN039]UVO53888.1 hypothetical protein M0209_07045 [Sphingomonas sp. SUN039]